MENPARKYLEKIIRMRKAMMRKGVSKLNVIKTGMAIKAIEPWLNAYPKATNEQVKKHISRHIGAVLYLIPGEKSKSHNTLINELENIFRTASNAPEFDENNMR